jgi:hypothetical protein
MTRNPSAQSAPHSYLVTWSRVVHASLQFTYAVLVSLRSQHKNAQRRCMLLELGIVIPCFTGAVWYIHVLKEDYGPPIPALWREDT